MLFLLSVSSLPNVREYSSAASYKAAVASAPGTYVNYKWPTESQPLSSVMEVDHVWTSIPDGTDTHGNGVFASSQMWWHADNGTQLAGGYMGSQVMRGSGGEERRVFIFSCWDHSADNKVGWTTPDTCSRFGGEGVGADGARGAVLLGGAQGNDHSLAALEVALHLRPTAQGEANGVGAVDRARSCSGHSG